VLAALAVRLTPLPTRVPALTVWFAFLTVLFAVLTGGCAPFSEVLRSLSAASPALLESHLCRAIVRPDAVARLT
jgi:hypothetical protein